MKEITLSVADFLVLTKISSPHQLDDLRPVSQGEHFSLRGTNEQFLTIVDVLAGELSNRGFDDDFEPTWYGKELERLIDKLSFVYE